MDRKIIIFFIFFFSAQSVNSSIIYTFNGSNLIESICQDEYPILHQSIHNTSTDGVKKFTCTSKELDDKDSGLYIEKIEELKYW